ncbi:MAG: LegC family aminotransferase [Eubacterium sp.]|jgi:aminotransferase in exopolysaccharide biosynthesis|nr:LegC family aminotransferase [Eubacterium sp.]
MSRYIPLSIPNFEGNEKKYVLDAVEQGWVSTGGAYITKLERMLADYLHTEEAAACQSGTSGIHLALIECGVLPGDMVLVPTLTFIAAVNPVRYQFAEPVFLDCDKSLCVDPVKLRQFCEQECTLKENRLVHNLTQKTVKALIVVHVFGNFADMEAIMEIAETYHIKVIEDATESLGSRYEKGRFAGKYAGAIGDFGVFSFNGNKIITTGGGGAVTAKNAETVRHIRYLSTQAKDDPHFYIHDEVGYNYRMTNLQAALGVAQMEKLEEFIERKHKNYELYRELFSDFAYGKLLGFREDTYSNQWFYALELNGKLKFPLRNLIERLETFGVQTRAVWGLIHRQKPYQNCLAYEMERAPYYSGCILNLPCSTQITEEEIRYAAQTIQREIESWRITDD